MALINFKSGSAANYEALRSKSATTLYMILDEGKIYLGEVLIGEKVQASFDPSTKKVTINGAELDLTSFQTADDVQTLINNAVTGVYKIKGSITVENLNQIASPEIGDTYNMLDGGEIVTDESTITVVEGDNVVWTETGWDKLAGTIDFTNYYSKSEIDDLFNQRDQVIATNINELSDRLNTLNGEKANKSTTLVGYGITDAYTKSEVDNLIATQSQSLVDALTITTI